MDDLLTDFLTETNESIAELDVALVHLERTPDDAQTLSLIFRHVHTIKGTCGFLGLGRLERVAHAAENVLGKLRDNTLTATPGVISPVLAGLDRIKDIIADLAATGAEIDGDDSALITALEAAAEGMAVPLIVQETTPPMTEANALDDHTSDPEFEPAGSASAEPTSAEPTPAEPATDASTGARPAERQPTEAVPTSQTIRVTVDVLENLMTLVSKLVLTRNQLLQLARTQENAAFTVPLQRLSHITSELQEGVMKTRMQPIGHAWNKLPRLVRDLSHELDKKIELVMLGADTELDRQVLELIKDPLTHMVRNSGDHGLETAAERRAVGKAETGTITLKAFHEGGHIIIEIADDGRGLPVDRIKAKILASKLATAAELATMTDTQVQRFIFRAGFSTAAAVTAVSGRGVGMDVVKTNIERIGGTIDLRSTPGQGTTFSIKIPLTLAIVSALIVAAGGERFAIPQISVVELVQARLDGAKTTDGSESVIERINDTPVLRLRDRLLPLINLNDQLRLGAAGTAEKAAHIVVTQVGAHVFGLIVDRVFDTEEIVVKPVAPILRDITIFSGNTILGDGSVIMILDPNGIARATGIGASTEARGNQPPSRETMQSSESVTMLLFRAGDAQRLAVPLGLVARLEDFPRTQIETASGAAVTQYRGRLMPLIPIGPDIDQTAVRQPVLVFTDGDRSMGLMVDEIIDVVPERLNIELGTARPGLLGTAVIAGLATDVIDTGHWLEIAWQDWFHGTGVTGANTTPRDILVVEDSDFFRQLLVPTLSAAGYNVTAVARAKEALALRDNGAMFDVIVSDIEMPDMDGLSFARAIRDGGAWADLPLIALSASAEPAAVAAGRDAGFTDYVAKFQRDSLFNSLSQCIASPLGLNQ